MKTRRQLAVLSGLRDLTNQGSQFIIATHSPILMAYPDALIYQCTSAGVAEVKYEDTEHFRITKLFLDNRDVMLNELMK